MRVLIKEPDKECYEADIEDKLEVLQSIVGGYIEYTYLPYLNGITVICNEEGKINNMAANIFTGYDYICGTIILLGDDGENNRSLTDEEISKIKKIM